MEFMPENQTLMIASQCGTLNSPCFCLVSLSTEQPWTVAPCSPPPEGEWKWGCEGLITSHLMTSSHPADKISIVYRLEDASRCWIQTIYALLCHANIKYTALRTKSFGIPREKLHFREHSTFSSIYSFHVSKTMGAGVEYISTTNLCLLWVY